ncbi:aldehyde dehydrogenase family protein [Metapseudomonas resinovorans]|uniref:hypothetical protein n=1 Tax=Metapseudomonas resinovorans TaxID=53412 RepID=UPI0012DBE978|nr:hypothetical protein [Pseudomonas resinovorans]
MVVCEPGLLAVGWAVVAWLALVGVLVVFACAFLVWVVVCGVVLVVLVGSGCVLLHAAAVIGFVRLLVAAWSEACLPVGVLVVLGLGPLLVWFGVAGSGVGVVGVGGRVLGCAALAFQVVAALFTCVFDLCCSGAFLVLACVSVGLVVLAVFTGGFRPAWLVCLAAFCIFLDGALGAAFISRFVGAVVVLSLGDVGAASTFLGGLALFALVACFSGGVGGVFSDGGTVFLCGGTVAGPWRSSGPWVFGSLAWVFTAFCAYFFCCVSWVVVGCAGSPAVVLVPGGSFGLCGALWPPACFPARAVVCRLVCGVVFLLGFPACCARVRIGGVRRCGSCCGFSPFFLCSFVAFPGLCCGRGCWSGSADGWGWLVRWFFGFWAGPGGRCSCWCALVCYVCIGCCRAVDCP